jgi:ribulose bisphosphate carboxylase small subunit
MINEKKTVNILLSKYFSSGLEYDDRRLFSTKTKKLISLVNTSPENLVRIFKDSGFKIALHYTRSKNRIVYSVTISVPYFDSFRLSNEMAAAIMGKIRE